MNCRLLHIYRNTPVGRESLLQSIHFCKTLKISLNIYIPRSKRFWICFGSSNRNLPIELDRSYLFSPETALSHAENLTKKEGLEINWVLPENNTTTTCPKIQGSFQFMCCPRCVKEPLSKLSVGHIDSSVRKIINVVQFPVLIPSIVYKPWKRIAVFFSGSKNGLSVLKFGLQVSHISGLPVDIFSQIECNENVPIDIQALKNEINKGISNWYLFNSGDFNSNIYNVAHDALVVFGGFHSRRHRNYSSKMENIQSVLPNNFLAVGPSC